MPCITFISFNFDAKSFSYRRITILFLLTIESSFMCRIGGIRSSCPSNVERRSTAFSCIVLKEKLIVEFILRSVYDTCCKYPSP